MAKTTIDNIKGLSSTPNGSGTTIKNTSQFNGPVLFNGSNTTNPGGGLTMVTLGSPQTCVRTGAGNVDTSVTIPAGSAIVSLGIVFTSALTLNSAANVGLAVGTSAGGEQFVAATVVASSATAAAAEGAVIATTGASTEGTNALAFAANAVQRFAAEQVVHFRLSNDAQNITAGTAVGFVEFTKI